MKLSFPFEPWNLDKRRAELEFAHRSKANMEAFVLRCAHDRAYFTNNCVDTVNERKRVGDPGNRGSIRPFFLCLRQAEALEKMRLSKIEGFDVVWPKSRNVGASWMHMIDDSHGFMFEEGYSSIIGSRTDGLVDPKGAGNMSALLPKFDFIYSRFPRFMQIPEYGIPFGEKPYKVEMLRINPRSGARIAGEAVTPHFAAGPRATICRIDELSRCIHGQEGWVSCGETTDSRHAMFTPQGKDFTWALCFPDEYAMLSGDKQVERPHVFRIHYKDIPWQNQFLLLSQYVDLDNPPWRRREEFEAWLATEGRSNTLYEGNGYSPYDAIGCKLDEDGIPFNAGYEDSPGNIDHIELRRPLETAPMGAACAIYPWRIREGFRFDEVKAAQELDCRFDGSKEGRVYAIQLRSIKKEPLGRKPYFPLYATCDPGRTDAFYMAWVQWNDEERQYEWLREISVTGRSAHFFIPFLTGSVTDAQKYLTEGRATSEHWALFEELRNPIWRVNMVYGDPKGLDSRTANARGSVRDIWMNERIPVFVDHSFHLFQFRIPAARKVMPYTAIDPLTCPRLLMGLGQIAFPVRPDSAQLITAPEGWVHHPLHSHPVAAFEYFACADPHRFDTEEHDADAPETREVYMEERRRSRMKINGWGDEPRGAKTRAGYF